MDEALARAMEPVLRDIAGTGAPRPTIRDGNWQISSEYPCAMLWGRDGSGMGVSVYLGDAESVRIVAAAENVQQWVIDELWAASRTNWPVCPGHPSTHPLTPTESNGVATWVCPLDRAVVAEIGSL
ncbi:hypothetical protein ABIB25_002590 [Nakamurella sp. UYEF19]|uniref:hypothetical protein n=1 Tax=Nakamurella sp. UYEF19 TaxID=1756392 RepID=UPI0033969EB7